MARQWVNIYLLVDLDGWQKKRLILKVDHELHNKYPLAPEKNRGKWQNAFEILQEDQR